jgi:putative SOS response-associated peptidase YedK
MCNDYRLMVDVASIAEDFADLKIKIRFSEGTPKARRPLKDSGFPERRFDDSLRWKGEP